MTDTPRTPAHPIPLAAIVAMVGKGMTARAIVRLFPELTLDDVRGALLHAADLVRDPDASLSSEQRAERIADTAESGTLLSDEDAMALAVEETRAARRERHRK